MPDHCMERSNPKAAEVYAGSNGDVTRAFYAELEKRGPLGVIAMNLFRAHKCSARAKVYRRRAHKGEAYDRKNWSMGLLCSILMQHGAALGIRFGWKQDLKTPGFEWVLYVDLPNGQVSFHAASRGEGPDYAGEWCGEHLSAERIIAFCDSIACSLGGEAPSPSPLEKEEENPAPEIIRNKLQFEAETAPLRFRKRTFAESLQHSLFTDASKGEPA